MVFIIGHTRKEYVVGGVLFPKRSYNDAELARGRKTVISFSDEEWDKVKENDAVKELLAQGVIEALDIAPVDKFGSNTDLQDALRQSEVARVSLQTKYDDLKKEALETIRALQEEVRQLKGQE